MSRDCKKCKFFKGMHPKYNDSFACQLDSALKEIKELKENTK